jgi:hypothetical protein
MINTDKMCNERPISLLFMDHGKISLHLSSNKNFTLFYKAFCCSKVVLYTGTHKDLCIIPATPIYVMIHEDSRFL